MEKPNTTTRWSALFVIVWCSTVEYNEAFQPNKYESLVCPWKSRRCKASAEPRKPMHILAKPDDDEDEYIDEGSLGDWRSFRMNLVEVGLSSSTGESTEGYIGDDEMRSVETLDDDSQRDEQSRPKSVSKLNEKLLLTQNEKLGREYLDGVWAHETPTAEVGGLTVRLPLEAEIYKNGDKYSIGEELISRINKDEGSMSLLSEAQDAEEEAKKNAGLSVSSLMAAKTMLWYKKSKSLIEEQLQTVSAAANEKGEIDASKLNPTSAVFLKLYMDSLETWQEVCLVVEKDTAAGTATSLVLNRPMAFKLTENIARLVLYGAYKAMLMETVVRGRDVAKTEELVKFLTAFEHSCAVYIGGRDKMDSPAMMIHGIPDLEGAREISPGIGIYEGGIPAAIEGVLSGKYNALDFRFFVGRHEYQESGLDVAILSHKYQPIASARAVALKQCIQLPKPLWHEVMELCGGELREMSKLELQKRNDIPVEETDSEE